MTAKTRGPTTRNLRDDARLAAVRTASTIGISMAPAAGIGTAAQARENKKRCAATVACVGEKICCNGAIACSANDIAVCGVYYDRTLVARASHMQHV